MLPVPDQSMSQLRSTVVEGPWSAAGGASRAPARTPERRRSALASPSYDQLRECLTPAQRTTLEALEIFRWHLAFVRRPLFQPPIPVLFDRDGTRHVVIREDGTLDEHPTLRLRG